MSVPQRLRLATEHGIAPDDRDRLCVERVRKGSLRAAADALAGLGTQRMREPAGGSPSKPDDLTFIAVRQRVTNG